MKILRIVLICIGILFLIWFLLPIFTGASLNIGGITGMTCSALLIACGILMPRIHAWITQTYQTRNGRIGLQAAGIAATVLILIVLLETFCMVRAFTRKPSAGATVVVLGCRVYGERASLSLMGRMDAAIDYLQEHPDSMCVLSGGKGKGEDISEAECMFRCMTARGIEGERLIKEEKSLNTFQNLTYTKEIMEAQGLNPEAAIVTSEYHEYRSSLVARKLQMEYSAVPARTKWWLFPTFYVRELYGILAQWVLW